MKYISIILLLVMGLEGFAQVKPDSSWTLNTLQEVNSKNDDYLPFWVDSLLLFTSNRKSAPEGQTLEYSEKVYFSSFRDQVWSKVKKDGYKFNSDNNTALVGVGQTCFYFYRSYSNNGELFSSERKQDPKKPYKARKLKKLTNINSESDEVSIAVQQDTSYFVSNRQGSFDIFMQVGEQKAVSLDSINSSYDELDISLSKDEKNIFFSSNRPGGFGGYDIYQSIKTSHGWSSPYHLGFPINTENDDRDFRWYNDSLMFLASDRKGGQGELDIWWLRKPKVIIKDSIPAKKDSVIVPKDSIIKKVPKDSTILIPPPELEKELKKLGLWPFKGQIQLAAHAVTITSVAQFKTIYSGLQNEAIVDSVTRRDEGKSIVHKFMIDAVYTDLDSAVAKLGKIIPISGLPLTKEKRPFIALLRPDGKRYAIFWYRDEYLKKDIFWIIKSEKSRFETIWESN